MANKLFNKKSWAPFKYSDFSFCWQNIGLYILFAVDIQDEKYKIKSLIRIKKCLLPLCRKSYLEVIFSSLFWVICHLSIQTSCAILQGLHFIYPQQLRKMYYLALVGDKWSEVEPPFLGSIAENLWGRIFPGSRVFWWLLAVYHLKKRARKYSKTPAFSFYQRLHIEINLLKRKSLMFQMKGYFWKKYYCYQLH